MTLPALAISADRSDEELLRAFTSGERAAIGELALRYEALLVGFARGLLDGRVDLARDAVQDMWVRAIRWAGAYSGRSSVKTWLYRILVNCCHDVRRKEARRESRPPAQAVESRSAQVGLPAALERLTPDHRLLVLLCYHRGLSHEDAAAVLEIPVGTLKSRLHAILKSLREALGATP